MGMMDRLSEWEKKNKQEMEKLKEQRSKVNERSEQEKLAKTGNFLIKGIAFWYLLPAFAIALMVLLFVGVWIWDSIIGLF